jgi:hypothetical protein
VLDRLKNPNAVTLIQVQQAASADFQEWLRDRRNRRRIQGRFERCGYVPVRNETAKDGLWKISGARNARRGVGGGDRGCEAGRSRGGREARGAAAYPGMAEFLDAVAAEQAPADGPPMREPPPALSETLPPEERPGALSPAPSEPSEPDDFWRGRGQWPVGESIDPPLQTSATVPPTMARPSWVSPVSWELRGPDSVEKARQPDESEEEFRARCKRCRLAAYEAERQFARIRRLKEKPLLGRAGWMGR